MHPVFIRLLLGFINIRASNPAKILDVCPVYNNIIYTLTNTLTQTAIHTRTGVIPYLHLRFTWEIFL